MAVTNVMASTRMSLGDTAASFEVTTTGDALVLKLSSQQVSVGPSQVSMTVVDGAGRNIGKVLCQDGADRRLSIEDVANSPFTVIVECNQGVVLAQVDQLTDLDAVLPEGDAGLEAAAVPDGSITAAKLASDAVTTAKILDGALSADATGRAKMADAFINAAKLGTAAVTTVKLDAGAVTPAKQAFTGMKVLRFDGVAAAGAATLTGAAVGDRVMACWGVVSATGVSVVGTTPTVFEAVITVVNQIQQVDAGDLSGNDYWVILFPATA